MSGNSPAHRLLLQEAHALITRVERLQPYALQMPMVAAAGISPDARAALEKHMGRGKEHLSEMSNRFMDWLQGPEGIAATPEEGQRRFSALRMRFNSFLTQFDIFGDALVQRSEHNTGVWVAGLDTVATDALLPVAPFAELPPVICYLDRGIGAAIRRARTRLPGGDENPLAVIRVPRERMVGSGIASSLIHEVGHQAAALLDLNISVRRELIRKQETEPQRALIWRLWDRWISEILADFWALGLLGITATIGLLAVVSLPRAFVFRIAADDPHPFPWIRVRVSCAMGNALFPHHQWKRLADIWEELYPLTGLAQRSVQLIRELEQGLDAFVDLLVRHRPASLRGSTIPQILPIQLRTPARLAELFAEAQMQPHRLPEIAPSLAFAVAGQARAEGKISPEQEAVKLTDLLTTWALRGSERGESRCRPLLENSAAS